MKRKKRKGKEGFPIEDRKKVKKKKDRRKNRIIPDQYKTSGKRIEDLLTRYIFGRVNDTLIEPETLL